MKKYLGLCIVLICSSCSFNGNSGPDLESFIKYVREGGNGLAQIQEANGVQYRLTYEPSVYKYVKENRRSISGIELGQILEQSSVYSELYFELMIQGISTSNRSIDQFLVMESLKVKSEWISLVSAVDTIYPIGLHYVAGQNLGDRSVLNIVFPRKAELEAGFNIQFLAPHALPDSLLLSFNYDHETLANIPTLNP